MLEIFNIKIELFEDVSLIGSEDVVSLFAPDDLADGMRFYEHFDELYGLFTLEFHEILTEFDYVLLLLLQRDFDPDIFKSMFIIFFVFY